MNAGDLVWICIWMISRQGPRTEASHRRGARLWCDVTGQSALKHW